MPTQVDNDLKRCYSHGGRTSAADLEESMQIQSAWQILNAHPLWKLNFLEGLKAPPEA